MQETMTETEARDLIEAVARAALAELDALAPDERRVAVAILDALARRG